MKLKMMLACVASGVLLAACGGGGGGNKNPPEAVYYSVGGTVSGLDGTVTLSAGGSTVDVSADGAFLFGDTFEDGSSLTISVTSAPFTQSCEVTSANPVTVDDDISDVTVSCADVGSVAGAVVDYYTGAPVVGARVTVTADDDGSPLVVAEMQTDDAGAFSISGIGVSSRFVVSSDADGYSSDALSFGNTSDSADVALSESLELLSAQVSETIDPTTPVTLAFNGETLVELAANVLGKDGQAVTGPVSATVTVLDPSSDTEVMPGGLQAIDMDTMSVSPIESFGALDIRFSDADGSVLDLLDGTQATVSIPLAAASDPSTAPATIPLYYFDEQLGYWVEEGTATLTQTASGWAYVGTVEHFTTWNADQVYQTVYVNGCVVDGDEQPVANALVNSSGVDYIGSSTASTIADGTFSIAVRQQSTVLLSASAGGLSQTITVTTSDVDLDLGSCLELAQNAAAIKLTWGENPSDLDSHFFGPLADSESEFHVYYSNQTVTANGEVYSLDVDDTTSFGPEIVTAPSFPLAGTYRYVVYLYSGSSTIPDSPARVEVTLEGDVTIFSPSQATGTVSRYWHVFDLDVDGAGVITIVPVQQFTDSFTSPRIPAAKSLAQRPVNVFQKAVEDKYYAK